MAQDAATASEDRILADVLLELEALPIDRWDATAALVTDDPRAGSVVSIANQLGRAATALQEPERYRLHMVRVAALAVAAVRQLDVDAA